jgi:hypothetical protein
MLRADAAEREASTTTITVEGVDAVVGVTSTSETHVRTTELDWLEAHRGDSSTIEAAAPVLAVVSELGKAAAATGAGPEPWATNAKAAIRAFERLQCNTFSVCDGELQAIGAAVYVNPFQSLPCLPCSRT